MMDQPDFATLIPELSELDDSPTPDEWIGLAGNYGLAIGYSFIFWPRFVLFDGYVLRDGFHQATLRGFEETMSGKREVVEAVMNHIRIDNIHPDVEARHEIQLRYLGSVLRDIHQTKLALDFPDRRFEVSFNDEPGLHPSEYELTFWQLPEAVEEEED